MTKQIKLYLFITRAAWTNGSGSLWTSGVGRFLARPIFTKSVDSLDLYFNATSISPKYFP